MEQEKKIIKYKIKPTILHLTEEFDKEPDTPILISTMSIAAVRKYGDITQIMLNNGFCIRVKEDFDVIKSAMNGD